MPQKYFMNLAALISGGVDSAVAVHLLCEQGYKPDLFYIRIGMDTDDGLSCTAEEDIELATATARKYGLKLEVVDLQQEYWDRVVAYTIDKVRQGFTPNPDVMCNKLIKFGCFEEKAGHAYDRIATGHYASTCEREGKVWLATAKDPVKDQTDFLAQIDYLQVSRLLFPLGELMKQEVRRHGCRVPAARTARESVFWEKSTTTTLSDVSWANGRGQSWNWKAAGRSVRTRDSGFTPSDSGRDWD